MKKFARFFADEGGASAAEYALILAIIGSAIVAALFGLRDAISGAVSRAAGTINNSGAS